MKLLENVLTYEIYNELRKSVDWNLYPEEQAKNAIEHSFYTVVAVADEMPVGMARVIGDGLYYYIADVVVKPQYQGNGYGKAMMNKILDYIEEITPAGGRASAILLSVNGKEEFYMKLGFKELPHEFCGAGMRKVIKKF